MVEAVKTKDFQVKVEIKGKSEDIGLVSVEVQAGSRTGMRSGRNEDNACDKGTKTTCELEKKACLNEHCQHMSFQTHMTCGKLLHKSFKMV